MDVEGVDPAEVAKPAAVETSASDHDRLSGTGNRGATLMDVHIEFVALSGEEGKHLARHQAAVMRKVLRWVRDHPADRHDDNQPDER